MFSTWLVESEDFLLIFVTLCTSLTESQTIAEIKSNAKILTKKVANGSLRNWIIKSKKEAVIIRPDKYIFGSASSKKEVKSLVNYFSHMYRV